MRHRRQQRQRATRWQERCRSEWREATERKARERQEQARSAEGRTWRLAPAASEPVLEPPWSAPGTAPPVVKNSAEQYLARLTAARAPLGECPDAALPPTSKQQPPRAHRPRSAGPGTGRTVWMVTDLTDLVRRDSAAPDLVRVGGPMVKMR